LKQTEEPNYYQLLNIHPKAEVSEIIRAYHEICNKFAIFPYSSEEELSQGNSDFIIYKKAYMVLTSTPEREKYDESLKLQKEEEIENEKQNYIRSISDTSDLESLLFFKDAPKLTNSEANFSKMKSDITKNMFEKAKNYLENEKYHESINLFRKLIDINEKEPLYHSHLGLALMKKGWNNYAQEEFKIALHCNPEDTIALEYYKESQGTTKLNTKVTGVLELDKSRLEALWDKFKGFFSR